MKTSATLVVLATALATACITVEQAPETAPPVDAGPGPDSGEVTDGSTTDVAALPNDADADAAPSCAAKGALGFCENFDDKDLPGAFDKADQVRGAVAMVTAPVTSGSRALRSSIQPSASLETVARLYKALPLTNDVEIEFDFMPVTLNNAASPASSFVTQVQLTDTEGASVLGGVQIEASQGNGALFAMRYNEKGDDFQKVGLPVPVVLGQWKRLRFRFSRTGDISLYDVSNKVDIVAPTKVKMPISLQSGMAVTIGAECYVSHSGFSFLYDSVVVTAQ